MRTPKDGRLAIIRRALWVLFEGTPPEDKDMSEKYLRNKGYMFGRYYATHPHVFLRGTHIILIGGNYHFALTYGSNHCWLRRYAIIVTDHLTNHHIEATIVIRFHGQIREF